MMRAMEPPAGGTEARLICRESGGVLRGSHWSLDRDSLTIGRHPGNDLVLTSPDVSGRHARVRRSSGGYLLEDLGSANGTTVNGRPTGQGALQHGDEIRVGPCVFVFDDGHDGQPSHAPTIRSIARFDPTEAPHLQDIDSLRRGQARLRYAFDILRRLAGLESTEALVNGVLEATFKLTRAEAAGVFLDEGRGLQRHTVRKSGREVPEPTFSSTVIEHVRDRCEGVLATDVATDDRWTKAESLMVSGVRSLICVPLADGNEVSGVLYVISRTNTEAFGPEDLDLLSGVGAGAGVALAKTRLAERLAEERKMRSQLGRFLPPDLVEQVLQNRFDFAGRDEEREVTVLFWDLRKFTPLAEVCSAAETMALLNDYFEPMVETIFRHQGVLEKFIGDSIMAVWGSAPGLGPAAEAAVAAARDMQQHMAKLNRARAAAGKRFIAAGVGIATGRCVVGTVGAAQRMEYTVIGDTVNLASRLCGIAHGYQILLDARTHALTDSGSPLPALHVRGKKDEVAVFSIAEAPGPEPVA
jgi:adenylate cyclase